MPQAFQHRRHGTRPQLALLAAVLLLPLLGCEEDVQAVLPTEYPFTLYGFLNPRADTQWVRVFPIEGDLRPEVSAPLDAEFSSVDLTAGESRAWSDTLITYADGSVGHVFWAPFRAAHGHRYRLAITRADGATTSVEMLVPPLVDVEPGAFGRGGFGGSQVQQRIAITGGAERLRDVQMLYTIKYDTTHTEGPGAENSELPVTGIERSYAAQAQQSGEAWTFTVDWSEEFDAIRRQLIREGRFREHYGIWLTNASLTISVVNEDWAAPEGDWDADDLIQPGTFSNVENGFGFVGSGYTIREFFTLPWEEMSAAGFTACPCLEIGCTGHPSCRSGG